MPYTAPDLRGGQRGRNATELAWVLDATAGGSPSAAGNWNRQHTWAGNPEAPRPAGRQPMTVRPVKAIAAGFGQPKDGGSWNIPVLAMAGRAIMDDDWQGLVEYCRLQLGADGLWGQEVLSAEYCWPPIVLGLCHRKAAAGGRAEAAEALQGLLDAHALLMGLCALPHPHPPPQGGEKNRRTGFHLHVCAPGIRNERKYAVGIWRDYWFGYMLRPPESSAPDLPRYYSNKDHSNWPARVTREIAATASPEIRQVLRDHLRNGSRAAEIIDRLRTSGVTLRTRLHVRRLEGGDGCAWFEKDLAVPTKAPTMAESRVGGEYRVLHAHPDGFNSGQGSWPPNGQATCTLTDGRLEETVRNLPDSSGTPPTTASIPAPELEPIYHVVIDGEGPRLEPEAREPVVDDPPHTPETPDRRRRARSPWARLFRAIKRALGLG